MTESADIKTVRTRKSKERPSAAQCRYLARGLNQAGGKLPLFDADGQRINEQTIRSCIKKGWAKPWVRNPVKPDWLVCKITDAGREAVKKGQ